MGRYAQRRRRGGGAVASAPAPSLPTITAAQDFGGGDLLLTFDQPITADPGGVPESGALDLDAVTCNVSFVANVSANQLQVTQDITPSAGKTLTLQFQPAWIIEPVTVLNPVLVT